VLVDALLYSLPLLMNTLIVCAFYFMVFGIVGLQVGAGFASPSSPCAIACRVKGGGSDSGACCFLCFCVYVCCVIVVVARRQLWAGTLRKRCHDSATGFVVENATRVCGGAYQCNTEAGEYCAQTQSNANHVTGFDNFMWSCVTIFQCITLEGWVDVMYQTQDGFSAWSWMYVFRIFVCCMRLVLSRGCLLLAKQTMPPMADV